MKKIEKSLIWWSNQSTDNRIDLAKKYYPELGYKQIDGNHILEMYKKERKP